MTLLVPNGVTVACGPMSKQPPPPAQERARVLYTYAAADNSELSLTEGEVSRIEGLGALRADALEVARVEGDVLMDEERLSHARQPRGVCYIACLRVSTRVRMVSKHSLLLRRRLETAAILSKVRVYTRPCCVFHQPRFVTALVLL